MIWDRADAGRARARPSSGRTGGPPGSATPCAPPGTRPGSPKLTGLRLDPYFTATKITWLADRGTAIWAGLADGSLASRHGETLPASPGSPAGAATSPTPPTRPARCCSTSGPGGGRPSCASCCGCRSGRCPRWCPPPGSSAAPTRPRSAAWTCPSAGIVGDQQAALFEAGVFRPRRHQVHLRDRVVRPGQHRLLDRPPGSGPACPRSPGWMAPAR